MSEEKTIKSIGPYDIINMMFTKPDKFSKLTDVILEKNFFIINRAFSIKYPLQASVFNKLSINKAAVIRYWAMFLCNKEGFGKVPYFIYTKGSKKSNEIKIKKTNNIDKELIKQYCKRYHITLKDYNTLLNFYNDELISDINRYSKLISLSEQEKKIKKS